MEPCLEENLSQERIFFFKVGVIMTCLVGMMQERVKIDDTMGETAVGKLLLVSEHR